MNMEDEELVKMVNPTLKRRQTILFFLIVVINGLKCIVSDIGLDTCARGRLVSCCVISIIIMISPTLSFLLSYHPNELFFVCTHFDASTSKRCYNLILFWCNFTSSASYFMSIVMLLKSLTQMVLSARALVLLHILVWSLPGTFSLSSGSLSDISCLKSNTDSLEDPLKW